MTLEELQIRFTADMGSLQGDLDRLRGQLNDVGGEAGKAGGMLDGMFKGAALIGGAAAAGKALIGLGKEALAMANDVVESESLFSVSMGAMEGKARAWSDSMAQSLGLNAYELRKNVGMLNTMLSSMGMTENQAYDMSTGMVTLANDMASFYNLSTEDAFTKLKSGLTGEAEPLKALGILVNEQTVADYAMRKGISKTGKELTNQQKTLARYGVIMEQTTKAQGDLARTADSPTNQIRKLNNQLDQAKVSIGQALQPALIAVLPAITNAAVGFAGLLSGLTGGGAKDAFSDIALTVDQATEIVSSRVTSQASVLAGKVRDAKKVVDDALIAYAEAARKTKEIILELSLKPMTTGKERIWSELTLIDTWIGNLDLSVNKPVLAILDAAFLSDAIDEKRYNDEKKRLQANLDTISANTTALKAEVQAMIVAAIADGYIDDTERQAILTRLETGTEALIPYFLDIKKRAIAIIEAQLANGDIKEQEAVDAINALTLQTEQAIGGIRTVFGNVKIEFEMLPTTTGEWRLAAHLSELTAELKAKNLTVQSSVTALLDTMFRGGLIDGIELERQKADLKARIDKINADADALNTEVLALVNAALADGKVDDSEREAILARVQSGAEGLIPQYLELEKVLIAQVDSLLDAKLITQEQADAEKAKIRENTQGAIGLVTGIYPKVEAELRSEDFSVKTVDSETMQRLQDAVREELGAAASLLTSAQSVVNMLFPGSDSIDMAVRTMFSAAILSAEAQAETIRQLMADAFKTGMTPEKLDQLSAERARYAEMTRFAHGASSGKIKFKSALYQNETLSAENMATLFDAYGEAIKESKQAADETLAAQMIIIDDNQEDMYAEWAKEGISPEKGRGKYIAQRDASVKADQDAYLNDMLLMMTKRVPKEGTQTQNQVDEMLYSLSSALSKVDPQSLTDKNRKGIEQLVNSIFASMTAEAKKERETTKPFVESSYYSGAWLYSLIDPEGSKDLIENAYPEDLLKKYFPLPPPEHYTPMDYPAGGGGGAKTIDFTGVSEITLSGARVSFDSLANPFGLFGFNQQGKSPITVSVTSPPLYAYFNVGGQQFASAVIEALRTAAVSGGA